MNTANGIERITPLPGDELYRRYIRPKRPVVITGLYAGTRLNELSDPGRALDELGSLPIRAHPEYATSFHPLSRAVEPAQAALGEFFRELRDGSECLCSEQPTPARLRDLFSPAYGDRVDPADVRSFMFAAGQGGYAHLHYDADARDVLLTQLFGRKYVALAAYPQAEELILPNLDGHHNFSRRCLQTYGPERRSHFLHEIGAWQTVLEPGETLLIPSLWWHFVEYPEPSLSFNIRLGRSPHLRQLATMLPIAWPAQAVWVDDLCYELSKLDAPQGRIAEQLRDLSDLYLAAMAQQRPAEVREFTECLRALHGQHCPCLARKVAGEDFVLAPSAYRRTWRTSDVVALAEDHRVSKRADASPEHADLVILRGLSVAGRVPAHEHRRVSLLERLAASAEGMPVARLATELGTHEIEVVGIVEELMSRGWLRRDAGRLPTTAPVPGDSGSRADWLPDTVIKRTCRLVRSAHHGCALWMAIASGRVRGELRLDLADAGQDRTDRLLALLVESDSGLTAGRLAAELALEMTALGASLEDLIRRGWIGLRQPWNGATVPRLDPSCEILVQDRSPGIELAVTRAGRQVASLGEADARKAHGLQELAVCLSRLAGPDDTVAAIAHRVCANPDDLTRYLEQLDGAGVLLQVGQ